MDAVQVWPQLLQVAGDLVAKAQDWPGADDLAERLKKTIPQQFLDPDEQTGPDPQIQQMQMEMQALAQENQQLKIDKEIDLKKLVIDVYNAETQRIRALSDNQVDAELSQRSDIQAILEGGLSRWLNDSKELLSKPLPHLHPQFKRALHRAEGGSAAPLSPPRK